MIWRKLCAYGAEAEHDGHRWNVDNHLTGWVRRDGEVVYVGNEHDSLDMLKGQAEHLAGLS